MKINEKVEINITPEELTEIITQHFKDKGYDIKNVYYRIGVEYDPADWQSQYPGRDVLKEVECEAVKIESTKRSLGPRP